MIATPLATTIWRIVCASTRMSYASVLSRNAASSTTQTAGPPSPSKSPETTQQTQNRSKRTPSPSQTPRTEGQDERVYILALMTDHDHHKRMNDLRDRYFPKHINKLAAHLTLFHALPESRLESSIIPSIHQVMEHQRAFRIHAGQPFTSRKGIAISIARDQGGREAQQIHRALQRPWLQDGFLSTQDSSASLKLHYTIMNKVDSQEEIDRAFNEVKQEFAGDTGMVEGLRLYRYDRGWWRLQQTFPFQRPATSDGDGGRH